MPRVAKVKKAVKKKAVQARKAVSKAVSLLTSWSFSRWSDYEQCPFKFKLKHIDKLKEPKNAAMERGNVIHQLAEDYVKGKLKKMPPELVKFKKRFEERKAQYTKRSIINIVEDQWAFTKAWVRTKWDDWKLCWLRIKLDHAVSVDGSTMVITDYKTGQFRMSDVEKYEMQLELYVLACFLLHPFIQVVKPRLEFLDLGVTFPSAPVDVERLTFTREDLPRLQAEWEARIQPMFKDTIYAPKPNRFCNWCHFRKANGGPCKF